MNMHAPFVDPEHIFCVTSLLSGDHYVGRWGGRTVKLTPARLKAPLPKSEAVEGYSTSQRVTTHLWLTLGGKPGELSRTTHDI